LIQSATASSNGPIVWMRVDGIGPIIFEIALKLYIAIIFVVVVCSLGNRPQGSRYTYGTSMILFGLYNIIALYCGGYTIYLAAPKSADQWKQFGSLVKNNSEFRDIVLALAATYGLCFFSSFLHFEPWHMFTSFIREPFHVFLFNANHYFAEYMFLLPSYVNILSMYQICLVTLDSHLSSQWCMLYATCTMFRGVPKATMLSLRL
jgi:chitin synthase